MRAAVALGVVLASAPAHADSTMPGMDMGGAPDATNDPASVTITQTHFTGAVSLIAAQFSQTDYVGSYEGAIPSLAWANHRGGAAVMLGLYRLEENGRAVKGIGDVMVMGWVTVLETAAHASFGVEGDAMVPTGAMSDGLGMGHPMASLVLLGTVPITDRLTAHADAGYGRAMVFDGEMHHHGAMPLVEPMNPSELLWGASIDVALPHRLTTGARVWGGVPVGETGVTRAAAGVRVGWGYGKLSTGAELQAGLAGDPFTVRGILQTGVSF